MTGCFSARLLSRTLLFRIFIVFIHTSRKVNSDLIETLRKLRLKDEYFTLACETETSDP